jgi:hypothetical protein
MHFNLYGVCLDPILTLLVNALLHKPKSDLNLDLE